MAEPVVFIVDDDELVRRTLWRLFESVGISCRTFASPEEFLEVDRPAGAQDFFEKPVDEQAMIDAVNLALKRDLASRQSESRLVELRRRHEALTARERQIFERVVTGMLNKQIASELGTSEKTVKFHRASVMQKMQAASLAELVRMAEKLEILTDD